MSLYDSGPSKLVRRIYRACKAPEPDLALNFEIADTVNEKQGGAPREAALTVVKLINDRDPFIGVNALILLDCLVKNCGYPFHLQISRKEFLNELVKRFPERPPHKYNKVQRMILTQLEEWNSTICKNSRYKKDLGFIRDMHRLLSYKGYIFPEVKLSDMAVLTPSENLKSAEEIQKEERLAQSAKLQELIRRGRPEDLKEANKLMKIMSGFKEDKKLSELTKLRVAEDISKIKGKAEVFSDMVNNYNDNDSNASTDEILEELYSSLKVAQPTLKKIIAEEQDDQDAVSNLLKLNDTINLLIEKYSLIKKKDLIGASKINVNASGDANLIDFDDEIDSAEPTAASNNNTSNAANKNSLIDLLGDLDLSSNNNPSSGVNGLSLGGAGPIALGGDSSPTPPPQFQVNTSGSNTTSATPFDSLSQLQNLNTGSESLVPQQSGSKFMSPSAMGNLGTASSNAINILNSSIKIDYQPTKVSPSELNLLFTFSNLTLKNISNVKFLLAVPKQYKLELQPQSNNVLLSMSQKGITQLGKITSANDADNLSGQVKLKYKVNFQIGSDPQELTGIAVVQTN